MDRRGYLKLTGGLTTAGFAGTMGKLLSDIQHENEQISDIKNYIHENLEEADFEPAAETPYKDIPQLNVVPSPEYDIIEGSNIEPDIILTGRASSELNNLSPTQTLELLQSEMTGYLDEFHDYAEEQLGETTFDINHVAVSVTDPVEKGDGPREFSYGTWRDYQGDESAGWRRVADQGFSGNKLEAVEDWTIQQK